MVLKVPPLEAVEIATGSIGLGFDVATDVRLKYCKRESPDPCLVELDTADGQAGRETVHLPGEIFVGNVKSIKYDKGRRLCSGPTSSHSSR